MIGSPSWGLNPAGRATQSDNISIQLHCSPMHFTVRTQSSEQGTCLHTAATRGRLWSRAGRRA